MEITKISDWSGKRRTLDLPITEEQIAMYRRGELVQKCFPQLTDDQREFILTGMTAEEWDEMIEQVESEEDEE